MPFEIPSDLHAELVPYEWLLGQWRGSGRGDYPTIEPYEFGQEVAFAHDGRPFLHYFSRSWVVDEDGNTLREGALETGFLRPQADQEFELVLAHNTGYAEIWYGTLDGARLDMATDLVARTSSAKELTAGKRLYGLVEGQLMYAYDMAAVGQPMQSHTWAQLQRA